MDGTPIKFLYKNYRGETAIREAIPLSVPRWGTTEWHPEPGYLIEMYDVEKKANREFALAECNFTVTSLPDA